MTSDRTRARMVDRLRAEGIRDEAVLAAILAVPRHIFVDEALAIRAYENSALPIGYGQTISQPWVVARMIELARNGRQLAAVLEVGTGCGYQTAVLAQLAAQVYTVERIGGLLARARRHLSSLKVRNVALKHADGSGDLDEEISVDAIVVAAGATQVPTRLLRYLKPGGRMVIPLAHADERDPAMQRLTVIEATHAGFREEALDTVRFVPLLPGLA
jgi:protein-L-isoaspartate(D-aspartate) O-methyltransferase